MAQSTRTSYAILVTLVAVLLIVAAFYIAQKGSEQTITPNDRFPVISYDGTPTVDANAYRLVVNGTVQQELTFTLAELKDLSSISEVAEVRCIDGPSGRATWTGVVLKTILDMASLDRSSTKVVFRSADGYSTDLTVEEARADDVLICYEMNGEPLPAEQGYPIRMVVPDHWGYKWAKWVTQIEVVDYDYKGYWESRGWADNAQISPPNDWFYHSILFTAAGAAGVLAAVSGVVNMKRRKEGKPYLLSARLHSYSGYVFAILVLAVFLWWSVQTFGYRGAIFYTLHGQMALVSVALETLGLVTGVLLTRHMEGARSWHSLFTVLGFLFFLLAIVLGLLLALRG